MDWTVYWFMLPACVVIASVAMFSGISGAAMLIPVFLIGFPLLGVPRLTTVEPVATSLFLETSGFGTGVMRYVRMRLVDVVTARRIIAVTLPLGSAGALVAKSGRAQRDCPDGESRLVRAASGTEYEFCAHGLGLQRALSGGGAFIAGLISTGVGEATLPPLVRRSRFPAPVAAATSTVIVAGTVVGAATTHMVQLTLDGGVSSIPWDLIAWAVPGAVAGAFLGTRLQGRISERATRLFFTGLFAAIGLTFLVAFTVFRSQFG